MELFKQLRTKYYVDKYFLEMNRFTKKLQAFLFTLLVGLSPLQGALASFVETFDQQENTAQMADTSNNMAASLAFVVTPNCGQCNIADACFSHSCSSGQCATCALAPPPVVSHPVNTAATSNMPGADEGIVKQLSIPLFRPPKI